MATRISKKTTEKVITPLENETTDNINELEIEVTKEETVSKSEYDKLLAKVEELAKQMTSIPVSPISTPAYNSMVKDVPVVNMCPGELNLATGGKGRGTIYTFKEFNEIIDIPFNDLKEICIQNARFVKEGYFYIADEEAVEALRKTTEYKKILPPSTIMKIFNYNPDKIIEIYKMAPKGQQELIVQMIRDKRLNAQKVDANIMMELGELTGIDFLSIEPMSN